MSTQQSFLVCDSSTLSNFKQWAQAISTWMTTIGWTQTSDTGQVNWGTIASVPAANSFVYEMWQPSSDPLQTGSTAYFLKIEYAQTSNSPSGPRIRVSVGAGTNGSGTLTGLTTIIHDPNANSPVGQGSVGFECDFSGDTIRVDICMYRTNPTSTLPFFFSVERTKNTDGSNSTDGVVLTTFSNSGGGNQGMQVLVFGQAVTTNTNRMLPFIPPLSTTDQFQNSIAASPAFPSYGKFGNPLTTMVAVPSGTIASGIIFQIQLYSATRTYMSLGQQDLNNPANSAFCMRYD